MFRDHENRAGYKGRKLVKIGNPFVQNMTQETSFERNEETKNASLDSRKETLLRASQLKEKHTRGSLKKLSRKNLPNSETDDRASLNIDTAMTKNQTDEENMVETSNDDIISTIVDLLDEEKSLRKMKDQKKQRKQDDRKSNQRKSKRKKKSSKKRKHKVKNKERKHKIRTRHSRHKLKRNDPKRIYKKDHMERLNDDDSENFDENLMEQEENFKENNEMDGDERLKY